MPKRGWVGGWWMGGPMDPDSENYFTGGIIIIKNETLIEYVKSCISAKEFKRIHRFKMATILLIFLSCDCAVNLFIIYLLHHIYTGCPIS